MMGTYDPTNEEESINCPYDPYVPSTFPPEPVSDMPKPEPKLIIRKNTWHYKYYCFIHQQWGFNIPDRTSLCPYCQSMLWGSVALVALSPFMILGWLTAKCGRLAYKVIAKSRLLTPLAWLLDTTMGHYVVEDAPDQMENSFASTCVTVGFLSTLGLVVVAATGIVLSFGLWNIVLSIPHWPHAIWVIIKTMGFCSLLMGYALFHVLAGVGWLLHVAGIGIGFACAGIAWFFTNGPLWFKIGTWAAYIGATVIVFAIAAYIIYVLIAIGLFNWLGDWILMRLNGFHAAKETVANRYRAYRDEKVELRYQRRQAKRDRPQGALSRWWKRLWQEDSTFMNGAAAIPAKVLGPLAILWQYLWALKRGVCPLVEFVNEQPLVEAETQVTPKQENSNGQ